MTKDKAWQCKASEKTKKENRKGGVGRIEMREEK
jgi:hypothetical protein